MSVFHPTGALEPSWTAFRRLPRPGQGFHADTGTDRATANHRIRRSSESGMAKPNVACDFRRWSSNPHRSPTCAEQNRTSRPPAYRFASVVLRKATPEGTPCVLPDGARSLLNLTSGLLSNSRCCDFLAALPTSPLRVARHAPLAPTVRYFVTTICFSATLLILLPRCFRQSNCSQHSTEPI
jgi:hypothetical protein